MTDLNRVGIGFDVHAFAPNRELWLGGIRIPFDKGLLGHSDADVLLHAVADALLGALALGDIGRHFPDSDPVYKGVSSVLLLRSVWKMIKERGYRLGNLDAVVMAEQPKMTPYANQIVELLCRELEAESSQINLKATTTERLGFVGREEGIAAHVVVSVNNDGDK